MKNYQSENKKKNVKRFDGVISDVEYYHYKITSIGVSDLELSLSYWDYDKMINVNFSSVTNRDNFYLGLGVYGDLMTKVSFCSLRYKTYKFSNIVKLEYLNKESLVINHSMESLFKSIGSDVVTFFKSKKMKLLKKKEKDKEVFYVQHSYTNQNAVIELFIISFIIPFYLEKYEKNDIALNEFIPSSNFNNDKNLLLEAFDGLLKGLVELTIYLGNEINKIFIRRWEY